MNTRLRFLALAGILGCVSAVARAQILYTYLSTPVQAVSTYPGDMAGTQEVNFELGIDESPTVTVGSAFNTPMKPDAFSLFTYRGAIGTTSDGGIFAEVGGTGSTAHEFAVLSAGESVESAIAQGSGDEPGNNLIGANLYVAMETADGHYGWAEVTVGSTIVTLQAFAVNEVAGQDILVGQTVSAVPEPGTWAWIAGMAVLGVVSVGRVNRRRPVAA